MEKWESILRDKLKKLESNQDSIQALSHWIIFHRKRLCEKSVAIWNEELMDAPVAKKLSFLYLANDIIQSSRRKALDFVSAFAELLEQAVAHVASHCDDSVRKVLHRLVNDVWRQRKVFSPRFSDALKQAIDEAGHSNGTSTSSSASASKEADDDEGEGEGGKNQSSYVQQRKRRATTSLADEVRRQDGIVIVGVERMLPIGESLLLDAMAKLRAIDERKRRSPGVADTSQTLCDDTADVSKATSLPDGLLGQCTRTVVSLRAYVNALDSEQQVRAELVDQLSQYIDEQQSALDAIPSHRETMNNLLSVLEERLPTISAAVLRLGDDDDDDDDSQASDRDDDGDNDGGDTYSNDGESALGAPALGRPSKRQRL
jgi:CID domain